MRVEDDPLFFSTNVNMPVPHSRKNDIAESDLAAKGYRVLSRLGNGQVDIFTREPPGQSRFVLFQGHPEYDPGTLGREYLRDMGRSCAARVTNVPRCRKIISTAPPKAGWLELQDGDESDLARYSEIVTGALPLKAWRANTYGSSPTG